MIEAWIDRRAARFSDVVVANSMAVAADTLDHESIAPSHVRVIRNGVEIPPQVSPAQRSELRARLGATDEVVIGCVANYRPVKRLDLLVEAVGSLDGIPGVRLVLVGEGPLRRELEEQIRRLGLNAWVVLHGAEPDPAWLYHAFDIVASASESEGLPNGLLEAAAASLPIVATDAGGTREVVDDGVSGLLVPVNDIERLTQALRSLIQDPASRREMGAAGQRHARANFGMGRFVAETEDLYDEFDRRRRSRARGAELDTDGVRA